MPACTLLGLEGVSFFAWLKHLQINCVQEAEGGYIKLTGKGAPHDSTLCALVKVDNVFTLLSIDEIIQMRPEMSRTDIADSSKVKAEAEDLDYKVPVAEIKKPSGKAAMKAVQVCFG